MAVCATAFLTSHIGCFATEDTANCPDEPGAAEC
jgi:hypothetical protein